MNQMSNSKKLKGVWTNVEKYDEEQVEVSREISLYQCIQCKKIYQEEVKAEECVHGRV